MKSANLKRQMLGLASGGPTERSRILKHAGPDLTRLICLSCYNLLEKKNLPSSARARLKKHKNIMKKLAYSKFDHKKTKNTLHRYGQSGGMSHSE